MDEFDRASELEEKERELRIAAARNNVQPQPDLGCGDCMAISHETAKATCQDFKTCLSDWQRVQVVKKIVGNQDA